MATLKNTTINDTGHLQLPVGTTAQRPGSPVNGDTRFNSQFKVVESYVDGAWKYMPPIVESGLVLHLDAAEPASYPGTGTTWFDLTSNNFDLTLVNGVGYSSSNGGSMVFDGVDDYGSFSNSSGVRAIVNGATNFTIACLFNSSVDGAFLFDIGDLGTDPNGGLEFRTDRIAANNLVTASSTLSAPIAYPSWNYTTFTRTSSYFHKWYLNGQFSNSAQLTTGYTVNELVKIGRRAFNTALILQGNISVFMLYSRVLSDSEIQQNFNALRGRYGL